MSDEVVVVVAGGAPPPPEAMLGVPPGTTVIAADGGEAIDDGDFGALPRHDEGVREAGPTFTLRPVQDDDRLLDHDPLGHPHERPAGQERVVQERERVG